VLFPTPFTPTKVILYGVRFWFDCSGDDNLVRMESKRSVEVLGVKIPVIAWASAARTAALIANGLSDKRERDPK